MNNKRKIIVFIIILLISIVSLVFKGYFTDEIYVLNESDNSLSSEESISKTNSKYNGSNDQYMKSKEKSNNKDVGARKITIYVSGEVKNPGVVTLSSDQRLATAVEKLGGLTEYADMNNINLAMKLEDEMHYIIPKKGEKIKTNIVTSQNDTSNNDIVSENNFNSNESEGNKININTADLDELDKIPGVGEATANKILSYREENGDFKNIEEIKNVNGIGEKKFENMKDIICVK
ncbi:helix-hairpin-helix domain-containing protein [Intestinibacter sp.]|uniref:helix-hairpin-helix domain-containing protein n=1 Tax=Intestinibacter sp. TaxID=1965304 RepID=UPI002A9119C7|nr:helix-hairpin-helix domain-containing protein [Intestinibacter sp.]MDY5213292.1 helix-hairpin-helix domain-containing protein [Intestinibacter sp.]